jgi:DNA-binding CsgD family transcriptional regulator
MTASALKISILTVRNHIYSIYQKTKAKSKIDLINRIYQKKEKPEDRLSSILS